ncbi:MAG: GPP34 family phosphoprotein [Proteobacteria bacterium]|nr:GPP34 family phosphoprotein [Pseudomonadota bacterium]
MLRFAEEILLLLLHDENGRFARVPESSLRYALGGGVLMDLALENRIDTDLTNLTLVDPTPLGDDLLDPVLADIAEENQTRETRYWLERSSERAEEIRETALARLVERGILERRDERFLWVFQSRRYPMIDGEAEREVKLRIMGVLFSDEIPDPRDIVILCLADACGIFGELLSGRELEQAATRIEQVRKLDLIGQAVSKAIWNIESALAQADMPQVFY